MSKKDSLEGLKLHVINKKKVVDDIYSPPEKNTPNGSSEVYAFFGRQDYLDDRGNPRLDMDFDKSEQNSLALAARINIGNRHKHYVKMDRSGFMFNPIGVYADEYTRKNNANSGQPRWTWREVSEASFLLYIRFLKTQNESHLLQANRKVGEDG